MVTRALRAAALLALLAPLAASAQQPGATQQPSGSARPSARASAPQPAPADGSAPDWRLRPGDAVRLAIKDEPDLAGEYPVTGSGEVLLPEVGLIAVAGRPFPEAERAIVAAYERLLVAPQVVAVPLVRVAVLGEVHKPGLIPVDPTETIADVLAEAGGLTPTADRGSLSLVRDGRARRIRLDARELGLRSELRSGDQILVRPQSMLRQNLPILVGAGASVVAAAVTSIIVRH